MTVTEQQTYVAQILADTGNIKWQNATHILPALNSAQEEFIITVLGFVSKNRRAFEVLSELQATKSANVTTSGYALSGVDSTAPFMRNGLIGVKSTLDSESRWCQIIAAADLGQQQNYYAQGNDERPLTYEFSETIYVLASSGSYPITSVIYYIREPKVLVASGASGYQVTTCELNAVYHRLIAEIAVANCWRLLGDESSIAKYDRMMQRIMQRIQGIVASGLTGLKIEKQEI